MLRVLILHASIGTGHRNAALALGEAFGRLDVDARVEDALDYGSRLFAQAVSRAYLQVSARAPLLWKMLYTSSDVSDLEAAFTGNERRARLVRPLVSKLEQLVSTYDPAAIVCTHFLPLEVLGRLVARGRLAQPIYCVITDFMVHSVWINRVVHRYFLASGVTRLAMLARGVEPSRLHISGIPVRPEIADPKPREMVRARHGIPTDQSAITLFGGGIDPLRVRLMVSRLLESSTPGLLMVAAGRNEVLAEALADLVDGPRMTLRRFGHIDYVDDLVAASDLVITKSGGLIVSEVLARGVPMIIIDPIPGQEEWNADFVAGSGAGVQLRYPEGVPLAALRLLATPERLAVMRQQAARVGRPRAASDIAEQVLADLEGVADA